jgi:hypothetical protein
VLSGGRSEKRYPEDADIEPPRGLVLSWRFRVSSRIKAKPRGLF